MNKCSNPKCPASNPADAYFCHICGHQLRKKTNGWRLFSIIISLLFVLLGIVFFMYYRDAEQRIEEVIVAESRAYYAESRAKEAELKAKKAEESKIQQQYYTKYKNQDIYYWDGTFKKTSYMYEEVGTCVDIYVQRDGYGLSSYGWVPMNCLRK